MGSLKAKGKVGGLVIATTFAMGLAVGAIGVNQIRIGGPLFAADQQMADFKADILPPPLYLVEPFMEATSLVEERTEAKAASPRHVARLRELATEYDKRTAYWRASDLPLTLKAEIDRQSSGTSRRFWDEVQRNLIPAAERGDIAALHHSHDRLKSLYSEHEQAVVQLVAQTDRQEMLLEAEAARSLGRTLWLLGRLASPYLAWRLSPCALFSARR